MCFLGTRHAHTWNFMYFRKTHSLYCIYSRRAHSALKSSRDTRNVELAKEFMSVSYMLYINIIYVICQRHMFFVLCSRRARSLNPMYSRHAHPCNSCRYHICSMFYVICAQSRWRCGQFMYVCVCISCVYTMCTHTMCVYNVCVYNVCIQCVCIR